MEQSNRERQEEELQVLQAIFMNEFEDLRSSPQIESGSPPAIRLKLTPLHSIMRQEVHAKVDLVVRYTTRYPTDPPLLRLENAKGLSKEQISSLKKGLDLQAKELIGEVMVLQLAQSVQAFLHKHNIPTLSFHEQMLKNMQKEKDLREKETEKRLAKDKAQAKEFDDDVTKMVKAALQEREEAIKEERKRRQQFEENRTESTESGNDAVMGTSPGTNWRRRNADSTERIDVSMETKPLGRRESLVCTRITQPVAIISFTGKLGDREVYCGKCVNHNFQGACTRSGLDLKSGEIVSVCEWILRSKKTKRKQSIIASGSLDIESVYQQVSGMEQELSYLSNKLQHPNLVQYHSIRIEMNEDFVTTRILMDYLEGSSLADSISQPGMPIDVLKDYTKQLVHVLNYLHSKSIVHRDLQPSHVFISNGNVLKVSGYAVLRRLSDLYNLLQNEAAEQGEFADYRKLVKPGKKGDIFNLGLVVLSLAQGKIATGYPVEIPAGLPEDLLDFLLKCLNIDEKERWSAPQLVKHSFLIVQSMPYNINNSQVNDSVQDAGQGEGANDEANFLYSLSALNIPNKTRLLTDFEILESLGKGGFGDVIKARKKLDGLLYAIKRINLNPKSAQLKKRIIREVKLLSRLNHENVVRYYSSWIEAEEISSTDMKSSEAESESDNKQRKRTTSNQTKEEEEEDSLLKYNNFEAPSINVEVNDEDISWCEDEIKRESDASYADTSSSSSDDDDDDGDRVGSLTDSRVKHSSGFLKRADARNSSEGVMFKMDDSMFQFGDISDTDDESDIEPLPSLATTETNTSEASFAQYLYIQMEYCEKSTLRNVIDEGLFKNQDRMWRLFREIVEGLSHVHSQGIIHRDLKPVNIFMDSRDQVKIGDFGLATSHTTGLLDQSMVSLSIASETKPSGDSSSRMTGKVGTYLYAAPEIDALSGKVKISERVDMYSLGIIFFEMCYKPLLTGMERVKVIGMLRTEKILLPEDFEDKPRHKEKKLLLWLLSHKSDERPTANELLESGLIPPKLEDRHFDELLALTLKQTSSTKYKRLTAAVFSQNPDPVTEQIYDMHVEQYKDGILVMAHAYEYVESVLREILTRHGAVSQDIPLLLPKCRIFDEYESIANVMDPEGIILSLPFDSRVSLARYIARNGVYNMKRYNIGKVYRDTKIHRAHPIEIKECSFDIICDSANSMLPDAEILYAVEEIVKYFPNIKHRNYYIRMNHTSLLKAILLQSNLSETRTDELYSILQYSKDTKECITKLKASLLDAEVPDHTVNKLLSYLDFEGPVNKAREALQSLRKARGPVGVFAKQAFNDLLAVVRNLKLLGLEMPIYVQTSLAYNVNIFSGIVFQFVAENRRKRKHGGVDILAAGGRYDRLIEAFKRPNDCKHFPRAVGVSIAVEKIVNSVLLDAQDNESISPYLNECDVLVGVVGESSLLEQRLTAVRELWGAGIRAKLSSYDTRHDGNLEALQEYCREAGINNLLLLKEAEADYVRIRTRDKEKFVENKVGRSAMCEYLQMILSEAKDKEVNVPGQKMQSIPQTSSNDSSLINTTFLIQDKLSKRRIESQILSKLSNVIHQSFLKTPVEVVVVDLPLNSLKVVFSYLEIDAEEDEFEASVSDIIDRQKQKKSMQYIHRVCSTLREIKIERKFVVLYGYKDDFYRIFL